MIKRICKVCKKEFLVFPSAIKYHGAKYCSRKCYYNYATGKNHPFYGKHHSEKTKQMIRKLRKGKHNSPATEFKKGKIKPRGEKSHKWKGGRRKSAKGYIRIYNPNHLFCTKDGYVLEHRLVMEEYLDRYLKPKEVVHHINNNPPDNRIENLKLFANDSEHRKFHFLKTP